MSSNATDLMPFSKLMGLKLTSIKKDRVVGSLLVRPDLCTLGNSIHGGSVMAFADALGAIGASQNLPPEASGTVTLESKTNFLGGAPAGSTILGIATPEHVGRRTSVWRTQIETEDGKSIAIVTQTQLVL